MCYIYFGLYIFKRSIYIKIMNCYNHYLCYIIVLIINLFHDFIVFMCDVTKGIILMKLNCTINVKVILKFTFGLIKPAKYPVVYTIGRMILSLCC